MVLGVKIPVSRPLRIVAAIALAASMAACDINVEVDVDDDDDDVAGSGTIVTERREVTDFERVVLEGEGRIELTQGGAESFSVTTDDNLLELIETDVRNGTLEISTASGTDIEPTDSVAYQIGVTDLDEIMLDGLGRIEIGDWTTESATVHLSGVGDIAIGELTADELTVELSGVGDVTVAGDVDDQDATISGVGEYRAGDLATRRTTIDAEGPTNATVWVTEILDAEVRGPASVEYYGEPDVTRRVRDNGTLAALGAR